MKQQEYIIYVKEGYEMKTSQMLDVLGIEHTLPFKKIELDGIQHLALSKNGIIYAPLEQEDKEKVLALPYVITTSTTKKP